MFVRLPNSSAGIRIDMMMMIPPIVGVPFFCICPSRPKSRISSPICFFCSFLMILGPAYNATSKAVIRAIRDLKVMYCISPIPGKSTPELFKYSNRWYIISFFLYQFFASFCIMKDSFIISLSSRWCFTPPIIW